MVRLLRSLGAFAQIGAVTAFVTFPIMFLFEFALFYLLPWVLSLLGQLEVVPASEEKKLEISEIIRGFYALSWFGGVAAAFRVFFPSELDTLLEKSMSAERDDDVTGNAKAQRFLLLLSGPWWIFVGYVVAMTYFGEVHLGLLGYSFDGSMTLFVLSVVTFAVPILVRLMLDAALWVRTGG